MSMSGSSITYGYNADGKCISKTVNGTTYNYSYLGDQLTEMTWGSNKLHFIRPCVSSRPAARRRSHCVQTAKRSPETGLRFGLYGFIFAFVSRGG